MAWSWVCDVTFVMIDVHALPAPKNGEEIQFRRFLLRCYERTVSETDDWKRDPVYHRYVEELQDQLAHLRNNSSVRLSDELIQQYLEHVEHLSNALLTPDVPLYCKKLPKDPIQKPSSASPSHSKEQTNSKPDVFQTFDRLVQSSKLGEEAKEKLQMHSHIQDNLTDDLLRLARDLKNKTVAMEAAVTSRDAAIASTEEALEYSTAAAKDASKRAKKQYNT